MTLDDLREIMTRAIGPAQTAVALEAICREAPGEQLRIRKRSARPEIRPADTVRDIQDRYRVSRATAYLWFRHRRS